MIAALGTGWLVLFPFTSPRAQEQTLGLFLCDSAAYEGYTLFAPLHSTSTFLIDIYGRQVHTWLSEYPPDGCAYLLENGLLLRSSRTVSGGGGLIQEIDWDGAVVWEFNYFDSTVRQHHDMEVLPNGHVLLLAWEYKSKAEAIAAGRDSLMFESEIEQLWPEHIVEVVPTYPEGGDIVWEWHLWDHLIQDFDSTKANYGVVADHPELVDINFAITVGHDWLHANAVDYNPALDQIILSCRQISQFFILDHSTTSAEAAGHTGGNSGMGGDILYRWGNPAGYDRGTEEDEVLFLQHDVHWIEPGLPGEGHIMLFNNGGKNRSYSTVDEIEPPVDGSGHYPQLSPGEVYGPVGPLWSYGADPADQFLAIFISGASRLANGNTLVCAGPQGWFFEVTATGEKVWEYVNPAGIDGPGVQGDSVGTNRVFRCYRYSHDYPGLQGRDLSPGGPIEIYPVSIVGTSHAPSLPLSNDSIAVTTTIATDSGLMLAELRFDTGGGPETLTLFDDGLHHDGAANDSLYGVVLPPMAESTQVWYYIYAEDSLGAPTSDPPNPPATRYGFRVGPGIDCGDIDHLGDGVTISDLVYLADWMFTGGPAPPVLQAADVNASGGDIDIADLICLVDYMFSSGPPPVCPGY